MSQIAQQDHLYVPIVDLEEPTQEEKEELLRKVKNGTILDTVLVEASSGHQLKILGFRHTSDSVVVWIYSPYEEAITPILLAEY